MDDLKLTAQFDFVDPEDPENTIWHFAVTGGVANAFLKSQDLTDDELLETGFDYSGNRLGGEGEDPGRGELLGHRADLEHRVDGVGRPTADGIAEWTPKRRAT